MCVARSFLFNHWATSRQIDKFDRWSGGPAVPHNSIAAWNERQAKRMPMLFSPTIGAAVMSRRSIAGPVLVAVGALPGLPNDQRDHLRTLDRHVDAAVTSLIPALSCQSCRPNAPFAELVRLRRRVLGEQ